MIRVVIPPHLRTLAKIQSDLELSIDGEITQNTIVDAIEKQYPMLRGTIRNLNTMQRQPFIRFFACKEDLSHESPNAPLPEAVASGREPFLIVGAIAGG